ncbi:Uncharacterised protein [Mycobacterium tuberculosis]|uniref:Uncharacterized protein n=1 Tax=Mycobacterium tuberculosis TaxID=1773 RepID=A0A0U0SZ55_MYCTX|nr:Uncharacterised protein [Mycobacterium tuberculosis]CFR79419.1 Uncharacterised protein [Mycobacterium tuberculosis]CFS30008.1 Uncharacterised protein [Mycobacterium tuberculosis]CKP85254.1 Uncharacterised protein [Mycobacterium tuberculosis]CNU26906.1 Uncharacterised protein [Mycobacterium tuberculosis]
MEKNVTGSLTWYLANNMRCTLNRSSGYRRCSASSGAMSLLGFTVPGKTCIQALSTGSFSSCWYSVTVPS